MLRPGQTVPALAVPTLDGGRFDLANGGGKNGTLVVFYRGLHCPICIKQLGEIERHLDDFAAQGVEVVAISGDDADRAQQTAGKAEVSRLRIGHSLDLTAADEDWGLWISTARAGSEEPAFFNEPGIFYLDATGRLYFAWVQSSPFARPAMEDVVGAIKFAIEKGYPPRGMHDGGVPRHAA